MKKIILLLLFIITTTLSAFAGEFYCKANKFCYRDKESNTEWSTWYQSSIDVGIDTDMRRIVILSKDSQVIDYQKLTKLSYNNRDIYSGGASDKNGRQINIQITFWKNGKTFIYIEYSDVEYMYSIIGWNE